MTSKLPVPRVNRKTLTVACAFLLITTLCLSGNALAWLGQTGAVPAVRAEGATYDKARALLTIKGSNFQRGATVSLCNEVGPVTFSRVKVKGSKKILLSDVRESDVRAGVEVIVTNPDGISSGPVRVTVTVAADESKLTAADVRTVIAQAVAQAEASGLKATIAVSDNEGNVLGVFKMTGATDRIVIGIGTRCARSGCLNVGQLPVTLNCGLEGFCVEGLAVAGAISKAGTAGVLSTAGGAFSTRSASFLLQEHLPPGIQGAPAGPLFGVQFSQLACSDVNPSLPLGLAADPGGVALYKNGKPVGGVGVEGDGLYGLSNRREERMDKPVEELVALAGTRGFEPPPLLVDTLQPDGLRLPYINQQVPPPLPVKSFNNLSGSEVAPFMVRDAPASKFTIITIGNGLQVRTKIDVPIIASPTPGGLTKADVEKVLAQGIAQALITRAVIHQPIGSHIEVSVGVVDQNGEVLGAVSTLDAPVSSYDISVQKARTATFLSRSDAGQKLRQADGGNFLPNNPFRKYAEAGAEDGVNLDGSFAISGRGVIFLSRPFLPDGIDETENGPFSNPIEDNSAFNTALQLDLVISRLLESAVNFITTGATQGTTLATSCTPDPGVLGRLVSNGWQVRQASVPLYKNGRLVGGVGCSGDGGEQEDIVVGFGSAGFEADPAIRSDRLFVRGVRIPWLKFPRHPNI